MWNVLIIASYVGAFSYYFLFVSGREGLRLRKAIETAALILSQFGSQFDLVSSFSNFLLMATKDKNRFLRNNKRGYFCSLERAL